ncbi:MAG: 4-diphosphocytidyl-2C-methyl-D-erythritol kinase [Alphaproteobacteria bacterium]|nr:MAG: 4-diphosphocytidyl-2C-methyl-D-erythritol kinase [Alphaproteobacteria bacterium]
MIFGELPLEDAEGAILAHSVRVDKASFKKGRVLSAEDIAALRAAGHASVTAAKLGPDDMGEDAAAALVAQAGAGANVTVAAAFTGRCNLIAAAAGVVVVDRDRLDRLNEVDEAVTFASLPPYDVVEPQQMVATVKIIPFAVAREVAERCAAVAAEGGPLLRVAQFRPRQIGLAQTRQPSTKDSVLDKTVESLNGRLAALGCPPVLERRCAHNEAALTEAIEALRRDGAEMVLASGASAITDRRDVIPASLERLGGTVEHFGMPVDPGNLLLLGKLDDAPFLGLPGCVRSPKLNGFDWVLPRLIADLPVTRKDIMRLGVGGLLKEIPSRPQPRAGAPAATVQRAPKIGALILAAGRSTRMGAANKLLAEVDGKPMVARAADAALASRARPVVLVTGHDADRVRAAIGSRQVTIVENPDYAAGMSTSLQRGLAAFGAEVDGVLVCLADMPRVSAATLDRLIAAFNPVEGRAICLPTWNGKRGNPVLWARRFFPEMAELHGDVGARHLIGEHADLVCEVAMPDDAVLVDVDTPDALAAINRPAVDPQAG